MIRKEDVDHLISANTRVRELLVAEPRSPWARLVGRIGTPPNRQAAQVLCEEFKWLVHENGSYWEGLQEASARLRVHREHAPHLLREIRGLVESEQAVFSRLGIDEARSGPVIVQVYSALRMVGEYEEPSRDSLANLKDRLARAQELICDAARGTLQRLYDNLIGHKGAQILAAAAVAGANVAIAVVDQGTVSWVSLLAGYHIMRGDTDSLIKIILPGD